MKLQTAAQIEALSRQRNPYQNLDSVRLSEPRVEMIYKRIRSLLQVVRLESNGRPVDVDGFRLRNPAHWQSQAASPTSELWHISTACNMRCPFCYEEGDPDAGSVLNEPAEMATLNEIETRLKYRNANNGTGVFRPLTYINEIFCNPEAMEILERIRAESADEVLTFVTNGTYLTEKNIALLAKLKPVFFNFSVNSLNADVRRRILRDREPNIAIEAVNLLKKYRIPYVGSLVCWPTIPWSDIKNTVRKLDAAGCAVIRYSLSAYSKHLRGRKYDREEFWQQGLSVARELMGEVDTPIKVEPYHYMDPTFLPNLAGVIKGSPAFHAGMRAGAKIVSVNDAATPTANSALSSLASAARSGKTVSVSFAPDGISEIITVRLDDGEAVRLEYPYDEMKGFKGFEWGIVLVENLRFQYLKDVQNIIDRHKARRVLICSSLIMKPIVDQMIRAANLFADITVFVEVPENRHFGGTVVLGDLLVVDDYVHFINEFKSEHSEGLDLVIIPSSPFSLGEWRRDLTATPFAEITRRTNLKVEMLECRPLNG